MDLNPLIFPEILPNIFKFLDVHDLFKCRKVCKLWNLETSMCIEQKLICINDSAKLKELYDLIIANENQPFHTFELWSFQIDLDNENTLKLISKCGPHFHHVTLNFDKDSRDLISLRTLRDLLLYYTPNLKSLAIRQLPLSIYSQKWIFPPEGMTKFKQPLLFGLKSLTIFSDASYNSDFLTNLLSSTCNLKEIIVEYGDEPGEFKKNFLSAVFASCHQLRNLESLQYFMHDPGCGRNWAWTLEECLKLSESGLLLKSIKLHPESSQDQAMVQLLSKFVDSLQFLKLRVHDQLYCPNMSVLTSLVLYDYEGSLVFLEQLPKLRHLGLCEYSPAKHLVPENIVFKPHNQLISLNLYGSCAVSNHLFCAISKAIPNLKILNFWHVNNEKLRMVIENFPKLEELTMSVVNIDDEGFSGLPLDLCEQIERLSNYSEYMKQPENFRTFPYIGQLKNLRRLEMHGACLADWKWSNVSDVSIYFALFHLENLTSLSFYEFKWITETAILKLCEKLNLLYLKLDSKVFSESLISDIKSIRPGIRLVYVTDEFESYNTFYTCAH